jgi:hypothetical protein
MLPLNQILIHSSFILFFIFFNKIKEVKNWVMTTHIGSLALPTPNKTFHLHDTLCVPHIHKNLVSVHHFTKHNNVFLELQPFFFLMKDNHGGNTSKRCV